jgi:hypothetical protein
MLGAIQGSAATIAINTGFQNVYSHMLSSDDYIKRKQKRKKQTKKSKLTLVQKRINSST